MDRPIVYGLAPALDTDTLNMGRFAEVGLGRLIAAVLGAGPVLVGFGCTAGAGMTVSVAAGDIYQTGPVDSTAYGSLPPSALQTVKQGILSAATSLAVPAPATPGQSIAYLVQIAQQDVDSNPILLAFYDSANPDTPYSGQNNDGAALNTVRASTASVMIKAGAAAAAGSQITPAPDAGYTGAWVITITAGQNAVTAADIAVYPGAPFLTETLPQKISAATANALITEAIENLATLSELAAAVEPLASQEQLAQAVSPLATVAALNNAVAAIQQAIQALAPLESPALLVAPTAPTQEPGDDSNKLATTAYADGAVTAAVSVGDFTGAGPWWEWDPKTGKVLVEGNYTANIVSEGAVTIDLPINIGTYQTGRAGTLNPTASNAGATVCDVVGGTATSLEVFFNDSQGGNAANAGGCWYQVRGYSPTEPVANG